MKPRAPKTDRQSLADPPKVIQLAERAETFIEMTELEPYDGTFIGKHIDADGRITGDPKVYKWWQRVALVPATIPWLFTYLREARTRNVCLIRGGPANLERQPTLRQRAGVYGSEDRGDHGFVDAPTRLIPFDIDGARISWQADPERAVRTIVAMLGEPYASASFVWFFSASHGLEIDKQTPETPDGQKPVKLKRWTGRISDDKVRVHIIFLAERDLDEAEAVALTLMAKARVPEVDKSSCFRVQINYITRPLWAEHPDRDVLGDTPTIGWVKGSRDTLAIPNNFKHAAYQAKAEGHATNIADHPDAESAVRGIGSDGEVRPHVLAAVRHLLIDNPVKAGVRPADHVRDIIAKLRGMIAQNTEEITGNLVRNGRSAREVDGLLQHVDPSYAEWCLDHPGSLRARRITNRSRRKRPGRRGSRPRLAWCGSSRGPGWLRMSGPRRHRERGSWPACSRRSTRHPRGPNPYRAFCWRHRPVAASQP